jgi:hypothetical protein
MSSDERPVGAESDGTMHKLTFFPLGNADCCRIDLESGKQILLDYADTKCYDDPADKRIALPKRLKTDLNGRGFYDVVGFTHLDDDHVAGSSEFFYLEHAACYQSSERVKINELWVPAAAIIEDGLEDCARVIRQEARHRLREGRGIRVFSRPELLRSWFEAEGISLESRAHLITDAGNLIPDWSKSCDGVEFFVHSPFATRLDDCNLVDRNKDSLVLHGTFSVGGVDTKVFFGGDVHHEGLEEIVRITRYHGREERIESDIVKIPHHCSYLSLGPDKGNDCTVPTANISYMYEKKLNGNAILVSSSRSVPSDENDNQPPHKQAKKYYTNCVKVTGTFEITMEHPKASAPEPLVIEIGTNRGRIRRAFSAGAAIASAAPAPRAGA